MLVHLYVILFFSYQCNTVNVFSVPLILFLMIFLTFSSAYIFIRVQYVVQHTKCVLIVITKACSQHLGY